MKPVALVPIRGISTSMTRLRGDLSNKKVNQLVNKLFMHTVDVLKNNNLEIIIVTADKSLRDVVEDVNFIFDAGDDLNTAIYDTISEYDADRYLLVMPDLPGLTEENIASILHLGTLHPYVICPTVDNGTALAILPADMLQQRFLGPSSSSRFIEFANKNKISLAKIRINELKIDLDNFEDFKFWKDRLNSSILQ